jgi:hypothetical protein
VGFARPGGGGRGAVAVQHLARFPADDAIPVDTKPDDDPLLERYASKPIAGTTT